MKRTNDLRIFTEFFKITDGGFYTPDEEERIMRLLAFSIGYTEEQTD